MTTIPRKVEPEEDLLDNLEKYQEDYIKIPPKNRKKVMPQSVKAFYKRIKAFERLHAPKVDESRTYVISGRGKGIPDRFVEPGKVVPYSETDDIEIRKKLREVSGMGHGNDIIEQGFALLAEQFADVPSSSNTSPFEFEIVPKISRSSSSSPVPTHD